MNQPIQALRALLANSPGKRLGVVSKVTSELLSIRAAGTTLLVPYRIGYRIGQRVIIDEHNQLTGKAPTAGQIPVYVV